MCRNPFSRPFLCDAVRSRQGWFLRESSHSETWQRGIVSAEKCGWCQKQDTAFWQHHSSKSSCAPVPFQSRLFSLTCLSEAYSSSLRSQKLIFPQKMKGYKIFHTYLISRKITDACFYRKNDHSFFTESVKRMQTTLSLWLAQTIVFKTAVLSS